MTDDDEILRYLMEEYDPSFEFYYLATKEPNIKAIEDLYNRTFGKPKESVELTGKDGEQLKPTVIYIPKPYEDE